MHVKQSPLRIPGFSSPLMQDAANRTSPYVTLRSASKQAGKYRQKCAKLGMIFMRRFGLLSPEVSFDPLGELGCGSSP